MHSPHNIAHRPAGAIVVGNRQNKGTQFMKFLGPSEMKGKLERTL
jgi:hypothetical protein